MAPLKDLTNLADVGLGGVDFRPPELTTERLLLRGWEPEDLESVYAYASDPAVTEFVSWPRHESCDDSDLFLNRLIADHYKNREYAYALCLRERPAEALGGISVVWRDHQNEVMELGYVLNQKAWGNGYILEASRALLERMFEEIAPHHVFARVLSGNQRSRRVCEKLGFSLDGVHREVFLKNGRRWDMLYYSILRQEWFDRTTQPVI